ncbi:MAG: NAD-dependent epimerase/dehydratase family protein [Rhodospirillales bacterium]|nr:NAD-dependent epimerase/dehydratase family protein [Rhodospirillales bacterium]
MKVVITGAAGFLGLGIAKILIERDEVESLVLFDAAIPNALPDDRFEAVTGDIADREQVFALIDRDDIVVFHLASVVSAGGELDFDLAMRVNLDGGRNVLEALRARVGAPKVVFASSLAVFGGTDMPDAVTDMTRVVPQTTYGATKAITELLVNDYTRKGFIDGRTARLPTVIIRPGQPNAAASGFASGIFREPLAGKEHVLPVGLDTKMMVIGYRAAVAGLIGLLDADADDLGRDRVIGLPNNVYSVAEMIAALEAVAEARGIDLGPITPAPDPAVEAIVTSWPQAMDDTRARKLGLPGDESLNAIIEEYLEDFGRVKL